MYVLVSLTELGVEMATTMESLIIDHLMDTNFEPGVHEAYAYCVQDIPTHRLGGYLLTKLANVDWDVVEKQLKQTYVECGFSKNKK